ncbi:MFS transporter [Microbacterium sp.]|uniref:MFS transporter n=1 Tax=Microbacterium sp. TaxID=51671 RepID=UPI0039E53CD2
MTTALAPSRLSEARFGWRPLLGSTLGVAVGIGSIPLYTNSVLFHNLEEQFGWQESALTLVFLICNLLLALASPFAGRLVDAIGSRLPALISAIALGASYLVLAIAPDSFSLYVVTQVIVYLAAACSAAVAYARLVTRSFDLMRGLALGVMNTGPAIVAMLIPAVAASALDAGGIRGAYVTLGLICLVGGSLSFLLIPRRADADASAAPDDLPSVATAAVPQVVRSLRLNRTLVTMFVAFFLMALATIGTIELLFGLLLEIGATEGEAIAMLGSLGLVMFIVRLAIGALLDWLPVTWVAAVAFVLCAVGLASLALVGAPVAGVAVLALGLALGSETDIMAVFVSRYTSRGVFGRVFGIGSLAFGLGVAAGPFLLSLVHEATGAPVAPLLVAAGALVAAAVLFLTVPSIRPTAARRRDLA